ncbi:MAG: hypothetical protein CMJ34_00215 [Phycisphaerae bacterium]|nr:hypothetical protein [Phycisphaerae bacterium]
MAPPSTSSNRLKRSVVGVTLGMLLAASLPMSSHASGMQDGGVFDPDMVRPPEPIPDRGPLPGMVDSALSQAIATDVKASEDGPYRETLQDLRRRCFGPTRGAERRTEGIAELRRYEDAGHLFAMPVVFAADRDDVRRAVIDHLSLQGERGQAALAWTAVHHERDDWRRAATEALVRPATPSTLAVMQSAFAASEHAVVERAGTLAGALDARVAIPHLIATQYSADTVRREGDLAWIAIGTQRSYVANLIPVTGDGSGAFRPVPGVLTEGFVFRVSDAVAVVHRTVVHQVLVDMTTEAVGEDTSRNGWSLVRWRDWYNRVYLPMARAKHQERIDELDARDFAEIERRRREAEAEDRLD